MDERAWIRWGHATVTIALAGALAWLVSAGVTDAWRVAFWLVAPELGALPALLARKARQTSPLYRVTHSHLLALPTLALASLLQGHVVWPVLAWSLHVEAERALAPG